ncbi:MAG: hypothetical protein ABIP94_23725 [Planctomycetota bacterium]
MLQRFLLLLATPLLAFPALAQVTGVPGINDLTVNGLGSGGTSCVPLCFPNGNLTLNLAVSAPPGAIILVFANFCPCLTCQLPGPSNPCVPAIPATACGGSNQSFDMDLSAGCGLSFSAVMTVNSTGVLGLSLPIPPLPGPPCTVATLSTQAVVIDPCGLGLFAVPGPFVLTQAFTLLF